MTKLLLLTLFVHSLYADVSPESVLTKSCLNSYSNTYKMQQDHKAFVYARESDTGKDRCGWGAGYASAKEAKKGAMKQCTGFQLNAECIIVDTDGEYLVKEGDFSTITQPDDTPLSAEEEGAILSDAKPLILGNCLPFFKDYLKDKGHKAFAYSLDANGNYACGKIYSSSTVIAADKGALKGCEDNKQQRGNKQPKSPCKVYAQGNKVILGAKDFAVVKVAKELSEAEYNAAFNKAKTMVKKGSCLFQMKYFLRGSVHQAYFLAQDKEGKQVCGRSEGEVSEKDALSKALKECNKRVQEANIKASCILIAKDFVIVGEAGLFARENKVETKKGSAKKADSKKVNVQKITDLFKSVKKEKNTSTSIKQIDMHKPQPLKKTLQITADTLNKDLPTMVDEELRLDKVSAEGRKMIFHYTLVHFTPQTMGAKRLKSLMYADIKTQVCTDKDTKMMLKKGMLTDYVYSGKDKKHITTFAFDAKACGYVTNVE